MTPLALIQALHQTPVKCVLALSGGGTGAAAQLLNVPGGSRTILEIVVPYHEQALGEFLGHKPDQFCSPQTSREMAWRAYGRARWLAPGENVVGLGCTASLASDRPKKGDHRFHLSIVHQESCRTWALVLSKGARDRAGEETLLDGIFMQALAEVLLPESTPPLPVLLLPGEHVEKQEDQLEPCLRFSASEFVRVELDGRLCSEKGRPAAVLPGSFNPAHEGHWGLASLAEGILGVPVAFELSLANVDKPELHLEEARRRLAQFTWRAPVLVTRAPTFVLKATLFPGATFVVGSDTAERILAPRYYGNDESKLFEALAFFRCQQCKFLVAGRVDGNGAFVGLEDVQVPERYGDLFQGIPREQFQADISSTELRTNTAE